MDRIRAPYNFVPFSDVVRFPDWSAYASSDVPFEDGISGTFDVRMTAHTPIFVRGGQRTTGEREAPLSLFAKGPDGRPAVPGTSLRGELRTVVEIATFGKLSRVNDNRYGVRDLHNPDLYVRHMARIMNGQPTPLVTAGWMHRVADPKGDLEDKRGRYRVEIEACDFAKVEYKKLTELARGRGVVDYRPGDRQSGPDKYKRFGVTDVRTLDALRVQATVKADGQRRANLGEGWLGDFGIVDGLGAGRSGTLVFTGQPSAWSPSQAPGRAGAGQPKHHDFVFFNRADRGRVDVEAGVFEGFQFVHADRGQQDRASEAPNPEWKFWLPRFEAGQGVPVFFLTRRDGRYIKVRALGLAMMFRLAYDQSVGDTIGGHQKDWKSPKLDFAETLFGRVPDDKRGESGEALKGRVSVGMLRLEGAERALPEVRAILGAPKASFYPNYIEQPGRTSAGQRRVYKTFMDKDARARGWKRYRPFPSVLAPHIPESVKNNARIFTRFCPLDAGSTFVGKVRVHNVRPEELGALLWAIDFGGASGARHTVGMARSLGYGSVTLQASAFALKDNHGVAVDADACRLAFTGGMETWARKSALEGGWANSPVTFQLLSCAQPFAEAADGRQMRLDHPQDRNEFNAARQAGFVLEPAGRDNQRREGAPVGGGVATASGGPSAPGVAPRAVPAPAPVAASVDDQERSQLRLAVGKGNHAGLLRKWKAEGGPREAARIAIAKGVLTVVNAKFREKYADVVAWIGL